MSDEREEVVIARRAGDPAEPTIGDINFKGLVIRTLERPRAPSSEDFIDGAPHPCIPAGEYDVAWTEGVHPKHPAVYEITHVPGRTAILIHAADVIMQLEGCVAPGLSVVWWKQDAIRSGVPSHDTRGVASSVPALGQLLDALSRKDFRLVIKDA